VPQRARIVLRRISAACVVVLAVAMVGGVGVYLSATQKDARARVLADFENRARLAASVTGQTVIASDAKTRAWAKANFSGSGSVLARSLDSQQAAGVDWLAVLRPDGTLLDASPHSARVRAASLSASGGFQLAMATGRLAYGDIVVENDLPVVYAFQPFSASGGTRMLVIPVSAGDVGSVLRTVLGATSGRGYVIDSAGATVAATDNTAVGQPIPDAGLTAAVRQGSRGVSGGDYYSSLPVTGSAWRVVITTPRAALLAPLEKTDRVAWLVFAGFALAVSLCLIVGAVTLMSSVRLAHARLHDTLTGLPSRALFLEETERALVERRPVAALFLDLDGFKAVNDTYGHAAGDRLLVEVARRLVASLRREDAASRFGGDEFLVLCRGPADESTMNGVAERIRARLSEPYEIDGQTVSIGVSIGIAVGGNHTRSAEKLLSCADAALYQAKRNGKGRIEAFTQERVSSD